jgi:hypothetical protein
LQVYKRFQDGISQAALALREMDDEGV